MGRNILKNYIDEKTILPGADIFSMPPKGFLSVMNSQNIIAECDDHPTKVTNQNSKGPEVVHPSSLCGKQIGPFRVVSVLGEGGMGLVYLAEQVDPVKRKVAIKVARTSVECSDLIARFHSERQAIASLDHSEIAKLLEVGTTDQGLPYFAMELIEGMPITEFCDKHNLTIQNRLKLFQKASSAVGYAHRRGLIHRDLKPSNILVEKIGKETRLKVIDFGLAKFVENPNNQLNLTAHGQVAGTPRYMSPEQALGLANRLDTRSDIFSLGVILFELITGSTPIPEDDSKGFVEVLKEVSDFESVVPSARISSGKHCKKGYDASIVSDRRNVNLRVLINLVKGDLDWIVSKATEREQERRYSNCNELTEDIGRFLSNEPIMARSPSFTYRTSKFVKKNRIAVSSAAIILVMMIVSLFCGWYLALWALNENEAQKEATTEANFAKKEAQKLLTEANLAKENLASANERVKLSFQVFIDSFNSFSPFGNGRNLSARDALTQAYSNSKEVMKDDPIGQADLFIALARSLNGLGENHLAQKLLTESLKVYEEKYGTDAAELLPPRAILLNILLAKRDFQSFSMELKRTRRIAENHRLTNSFHWLKCKLHDARVKIFSADEKVIKEGLTQFDSLIIEFGNFDKKKQKEILTYQSEFAFAAFWLKGDRANRKLLEEILRRQIEVLGLKNPATVLTKIRLLRNNLILSGEQDEVRTQQKMIEELKLKIGENHPDLLLVEAELAQLLVDSYQFKNAEKLCESLLPKFRIFFGKESEYTLRLHHTYIEAIQDVFGKRSTLEEIKKINCIWKQKFPSYRQDIRLSDMLLAKAHYAADDPEEALEKLREIIGPEIVDGRGFNRVTDKAFLAAMQIHQDTGNYDEAIKYGKMCLEARPKGLLKGNAHFLLGHVYYQLKQFDNAKVHFESAANYYSEGFDKTRSYTAGRIGCKSIEYLSLCQWNLSDPKGAISSLKRAFELMKELIGDKPEKRASGIRYLVRYLNRIDRFIEHQPSLKSSFDLEKEIQIVKKYQKRLLGIHSIDTLLIVETFTTLLYSREKYQDALDVLLEFKKSHYIALKNADKKKSKKIQELHFYRLRHLLKIAKCRKALGKRNETKDDLLQFAEDFKRTLKLHPENKSIRQILSKVLTNSNTKSSLWKEKEDQVLYKELRALAKPENERV